MENREVVYVVNYIVNTYDIGLYNEVYVYGDALQSWGRFMALYNDMIDGCDEPSEVDLGAMRERLVNGGESISLHFTDNGMEDHLLSVSVECVIKKMTKAYTDMEQTRKLAEILPI